LNIGRYFDKIKTQAWKRSNRNPVSLLPAKERTSQISST